MRHTDPRMQVRAHASQTSQPKDRIFWWIYRQASGKSIVPLTRPTCPQFHALPLCVPRRRYTKDTACVPRNPLSRSNRCLNRSGSHSGWLSNSRSNRKQSHVQRTQCEWRLTAHYNLILWTEKFIGLLFCSIFLNLDATLSQMLRRFVLHLLRKGHFDLAYESR
jgi:hypothetical protein